MTGRTFTFGVLQLKYLPRGAPKLFVREYYTYANNVHRSVLNLIGIVKLKTVSTN